MKKRFFFGLAIGVFPLWMPSANGQTAPTITQQPVSQFIAVGANATFSVSVSVTGTFTYQWQFDGTNIPNGVITIVAGGGNNYRSDGGPATNAVMDNPFGVAVDGFGNLFIADTENCRIREVGTNGIITTVAGNGTEGYSGDGKPATNAELYGPCGVAVDGFGNLFIADTYSGRVREVETNSIITTVAGNGTGGYSGDGANAMLDNPFGIAVDRFGNLYIADGNSHIRRVGTNGVITTVAGNGYANQWNQGGYSGDGGASTSAELNWPAGVSVDAFGNLFIVDTWNDRIRKVEINGIITTVAGNGTSGYSGDGGVATSAELSGPNGVTVDAFGSLFIADSGNQRIRKVVFQGASLVFPSVVISNAGSYDVVVTSPYGSVTSSVVMLTVEQITPVVTSFSLTNFGFSSSNTFQIQFTNTPGTTFSLWASTNLSNWTQIGTTTENLPGTYEANDPSATNCGVRFYQLRWP
jgi:hypothetical protein